MSALSVAIMLSVISSNVEFDLMSIALKISVGLLLVGTVVSAGAQENSTKLESGATFAVKPMDGFEFYVMAALYKKDLPIELVRDAQKATYIVDGHLVSTRASTSKVFWLGNDGPHQDVELNVYEVKSGTQVMHDADSTSLAERGAETIAEVFANDLQRRLSGQPKERAAVPLGSKVYVTAKEDFKKALVEAIAKKEVSVKVVDREENADYVLEADATSMRADTRKKVLMLSWQSDEQAAIVLTNRADGKIAYAYAYYGHDTAHGQRSSAESCAKHLGEMQERANNSRK